MVRPEYWIKYFEDKEYKELVEEKNRLVAFITSYEEKASSDSWTTEDCEAALSLDVRYWYSLEYLSRLCALMHDKFEVPEVSGFERKPGYNEHQRDIRIKRPPAQFNSYEWNDDEKRMDLFYDDILVGSLRCDRYSYIDKMKDKTVNKEIERLKKEKAQLERF